MKILFAFCLAGLLTTCSKPKNADNPLPFYIDKDLGPHWIKPNTTEWTAISRIPSFRLTDQNGQTFTEKDLDGKIVVAHFFFTRCAGICPKTIRNVKKVAGDLQNDEGVIFLSYSVTPEIDSPPILRAYAAEHSLPTAHWRLLTGERQTIYQLAREAFFADEDLGNNAPRGSDFLHSENVYLLDSERRLRGLYKGTFEPEMARLVEDISCLKK